MRRHRVALNLLLVAGVLAAALLFTAAGPAPGRPTPASEVLPAATEGHPDSLAGYAQAVEAFWRWVTTSVAQEQAAAARAAAASAAAAPPPVPVAPLPPPAAPAAPQGGDAGIWACIIGHESGGNPGAVNPTSGAAGLFQFELGTWLSPSISSITGAYPGGAATAPASVQWAAAESYEAQNGWSAWRGDGCTPDG